MSERCALEATQLRAVKSAKDVQGSLRGLAPSEVVCIRADAYIYMYRYAHKDIYIYIILYYIILYYIVLYCIMLYYITLHYIILYYIILYYIIL